MAMHTHAKYNMIEYADSLLIPDKESRMWGVWACELVKGPLLSCCLIPRSISLSIRNTKLPKNMTKPETITIQNGTMKKSAQQKKLCENQVVKVE